MRCSVRHSPHDHEDKAHWSGSLKKFLATAVVLRATSSSGCPNAVATVDKTCGSNAGSFLFGRTLLGTIVRGARYGASVSIMSLSIGMVGSSAASSAPPRSGRSSHTHPVMPMYRPSLRHSCSSASFPVKQCRTPGTVPLPAALLWLLLLLKLAAFRISANRAPASLQCMNSGLRSCNARLTWASNHLSCTSGGLKFLLKSSPHSPDQRHRHTQYVCFSV
jgi:hypothetical protein